MSKIKVKFSLLRNDMHQKKGWNLKAPHHIFINKTKSVCISFANIFADTYNCMLMHFHNDPFGKPSLCSFLFLENQVWQNTWPAWFKCKCSESALKAFPRGVKYSYQQSWVTKRSEWDHHNNSWGFVSSPTKTLCLIHVARQIMTDSYVTPQDYNLSPYSVLWFRW